MRVLTDNSFVDHRQEVSSGSRSPWNIGSPPKSSGLGTLKAMDTTFLRTAATRQVTAGAAEFGSAEIRCSSFDWIFIETKSTDQRKY